MKVLFLLALVVCLVMTVLYFNGVVVYDIAMPIMVGCMAIMTLDKTINAWKIKNKRAFGIFGFALVLCVTFVITALLGII